MIQCNGKMNTYNDSLPNKIGFIGGGKMALALGKGFMAAGLVSPDQVSFLYSCSKCNLQKYSIFLLLDLAIILLFIFFKVLASAPSDNNLVQWRQFNASTTHINSDVIRKCDVIFLAVKPHLFPGVIKAWQNEAKGNIHQDGTTAINEEENGSNAPHFLSSDPKLFISVMAGVTTKTLYDSLSSVVTNPRIIRANPNTPAMVGCGASAFSLGIGNIQVV